jgi:hypothetical protein
MSRIFFAIAVIAAPGAAFAHVGHVGEVAGHDHWIAIAAVGIAAAVWAAGKLKGRSEESEQDEQADEADAKTAET